ATNNKDGLLDDSAGDRASVPAPPRAGAEAQRRGERCQRTSAAGRDRAGECAAASSIRLVAHLRDRVAAAAASAATAGRARGSVGNERFEGSIRDALEADIVELPTLELPHIGTDGGADAKAHANRLSGQRLAQIDCCFVGRRVRRIGFY